MDRSAEHAWSSQDLRFKRSTHPEVNAAAMDLGVGPVAERRADAGVIDVPRTAAISATSAVAARSARRPIGSCYRTSH